MKIMKVSLLAALIGLSGSVYAAETVVESFSGWDVGATVDNDSNVANVVSDEFSSDNDGQSWKITFTSTFQGNTIWGDWDWSNEKTFKVDVLNKTASDQEVIVKLIGKGTDWTESYNLYGGATLSSSDEAQTVEIDLDATTAGENFSKTGVGGIQVMLGADPTQTVDIYFDNIRVDDGVDEPEAPGGQDPDYVVIESFGDYELGYVIDDAATSDSNMVSGDYSSDNDGKSWKVDYSDAYQGTSMWGEWDWGEHKTFEFDVINNSGETVDVVIKLIAQNTDWSDAYNLYGGATLDSSTEPQTIQVDLDSSVAGANFTKGAVGGIQFMLGKKPTTGVSVYFDNIRVSGDEEGTLPPNPDNPVYINAGSVGGIALLTLALFGLFRRKY
ncbi:GlyGly-CTERM sorting domain-containing protein [Thaumasiovibrio sp. DFM-14]|uniref:GlyGly-CTERM sorting domain-containing protein n=1 Tax=Thaumasiovibrio sp. DFM-14 TaxID=3384792 RepID=UPI0039A3823B